MQPFNTLPHTVWPSVAGLTKPSELLSTQFYYWTVVRNEFGQKALTNSGTLVRSWRLSQYQQGVYCRESADTRVAWMRRQRAEFGIV